ncbi:hypothetical protein HMPREF0063_12868 [Aeromicrobium marinum DSM 15272]|uniref:ATPase AAA-type core domain-containing protein n=1 Tax=Aeromicrobium marinum DSM 15272 TaxID=585531 RepID=E2SFQ9_9ACTN|nr:ATP-binding protein [Aeromicrobium marinum]EFQ82026.1 hypothetical protein HMPREF0063_12868 [Aeromicrobium marinum DSM 15272]
MREWSEKRLWQQLAAASRDRETHSLNLGHGNHLDLDLSKGCTVVAGRNGAGKSQVLAAAKGKLGDQSTLIQLHQICEHARSALRSRDDIEEMEEETGALPLTDELISNLKRVVGRDYEEVQWFSLELEATASFRDSFEWPGDQALVPHFRVKYRGAEYTSLEMGLGEFSIHLLFWTLQQFRDRNELTVLLDEPDAYLPPIGSSRLLARMLDTCLRRNWSLVIATHSEEMIRASIEEDSLLVVRRAQDSSIEAIRSWVDGPAVATDLLAVPALELVIFGEDEAAAALVRSILRSGDGRHARTAEVVWNNGHGYLTSLRRQIPRHSRMKVRFAYAYDGDQRNQDSPPDTGWPSVYLP